MTIMLAGPVLADEGIEILTPPRAVSTGATSLHVVGYTSAPEVDITVLGSRPQRVAVVDSVFHAHVWFGYGLQDVVVSLPGSSAVAETLRILSSPRRQRKYESFFPRYDFHRECPPQTCLVCHAPPEIDSRTPTPIAPTTMEDSEWCLGCHDEIRDLFRSHIPDRTPSCQDCHQVGPDLTLTRMGDFATRNPCYGCHKDKIGQFEQEYIHGPVAGGTCTVCHNPHGSVYEKNLLTAPGVLCASCHPMEDLDRLPVQHQPFLEGKCVACHDPHATNYKWVLRRSSEKLCLTCHFAGEGGNLRNHTHPYNVKPRNRLVQDLKLTERGRLECLSCHDPHATSSPHLLRTAQVNTCVGCHPGHQ